MVGLLGMGLAVLCFGLFWSYSAIRPFFRLHQDGVGFSTFSLAQISFLAFLLLAARSGFWVGILGAFFPPSVFLVLPAVPVELTLRVLPFALVTAAIVALVAIRLEPLRPFAILLVALGFAAGFLFPGERLSRRAMCDAAEAEGLLNVRRNTLGWSVVNTGREFQFELHALAQRGEQDFAWSYGQMAWYPLAETVARNVDTGRGRC